MRHLTLETVYKELLHIAANERPVDPRFHELLNEVRTDLKQRQEWRIEGMEPDREFPLSDWWSGYPGLATYIPE